MGDGAIPGLPASPPPGPSGLEGDSGGATSGERSRTPDATDTALATAHAASGASLGMRAASSFSPDVSSSEEGARIEVTRGRELREAGPVDGSHIGTLNVGDRFAALSQNSPETVSAAGPNTPGRASMDISVEGATSPPPVSSGEGPRGRLDTPRIPEEEFSSSGPMAASGSRRRRSGSRGGASVPMSFGSISATAVPAGAGGSSSAVPASGVAPMAGGRQTFVFDVHDVHNMGGSPSSLSITNRATGKVVSSIPLQPGDSRITADLPAGDYSVEAVSGMRPGTGPSSGADNLDNFRVDVFTTGGAGAGAGAPGGGGAAPSQ